MSLKDEIRKLKEVDEGLRLYEKYGVVSNPFPSSSQTSDNPHYAIEEADNTAVRQIMEFFQDGGSQAIVVEATQGVGKTNFLNHFESEIRGACEVMPEDYYVVRYLADPEKTFDATIHRLFEELGPEHLYRLADKLRHDHSHIDIARSQDVQRALDKLVKADSPTSEPIKLMMEWLLGLRLLKMHRESLGVQFRLDTVESKTAALRDIVEVSRSAGILKGIFLLLDELEKQDALGPRAVVRYLSAIRAIIDALPRGLFLMIAVTPDALRRYATALPALRGRLQNRIELSPLKDVTAAAGLARFYVDSARERAARSQLGDVGTSEILTEDEIKNCYKDLSVLAERRGDDGVRQRDFLNELNARASGVMFAARS